MNANDTIQIRPFREPDLAAMKDITVEAFEGVSIDRNIQQRFGLVNERDWQWRKGQAIEDDVRRQPESVFVATVEEKVIGYITTWVDRDAGLGFIPNLAVAASWRGQGLGRRLIAHALDFFRAEGLSHARIETLEQNDTGKHLYPDMGFVEVARQIHYCLEL